MIQFTSENIYVNNMKTRLVKLDLKVVLFFAAIYIIWGTTYLATKIAISELPPFLLAAMRYLLAGTALLGYCMIKKQRPVRVSIFGNMALGALMLTLGQGIVFWAQIHLSSGLTAVLAATLPICYLLVDRKNWKAYFHSKRTIVSILLGLTGILLLFFDQLTVRTNEGYLVMIASVAVIISCLCWAWGSIYYNDHSTLDTLFPDVSWQLLGGAAVSFAVSLFLEPLTDIDLQQVSIRTWGALAYLAIAGSIIAFSALYFLLSVRPPAVVGTYAYLNPIIAVVLGVMVVGEKISTIQVLGIVVILVGAYLSNRVKLKS